MTLLWFKLGLLLFWALWLTIIVLTNVFDALQAAGRLSPNWRFVSRNFARLVGAAEVYGWGPRLAAALFIPVIVWQIVVAALFWYAAVVSIAAGSLAWPAVDLAFALVLALWAAFMLAEEIFKQYRTETSHILFFTVQLLSWLALYLLP